MRIVVLAGGYSPERDISLSSGSLIANALLRRGHEVALVDVYRGIKTPEEGAFKCGNETQYHYEIPACEPDLDALRESLGGQTDLIGPGVLELCKSADITFVALHGAMGENGQLQATLDNYSIRYTGSGFEGCLLAMNKALSKQLLQSRNIPTPVGVELDLTQPIPKDLPLPCFVKPCSCGSSVGISRAETAEELERAIALAGKYETRILVEQEVLGREFSVGVLNGKALPPIEIIPQDGFYDYERKYQSGKTVELCPAPLKDEECQRMQGYALRVFEALRLRDYARMDFIMDRTGECYCLEANTLPGMTPMSLLPQEAAVDGIGYDDLCELIVSLGNQR